MKILIDMNLSPEWVGVLEAAGLRATHWSSIGKASAPDEEIFKHAKKHDYVIFTHDLDFGSILASTNASYPSVIQVRVQDVTPNYLSSFFISAINQFKDQLSAGALITIDEKRSRARILPLRR